MDDQKDDKKGQNGCFIIAFLLMASGIPVALQDQENLEAFSFFIWTPQPKMD